MPRQMAASFSENCPRGEPFSPSTAAAANKIGAGFSEHSPREGLFPRVPPSTIRGTQVAPNTAPPYAYKFLRIFLARHSPSACHSPSTSLQGAHCFEHRSGEPPVSRIVTPIQFPFLQMPSQRHASFSEHRPRRVPPQRGASFTECRPRNWQVPPCGAPKGCQFLRVPPQRVTVFSFAATRGFQFL